MPDGGETISNLRARRARQQHARRLAYQRQWYARHKAAQSATFLRMWEANRAANAGLTVAQYRARPRVQLACCGVWQAVTTLPHVCAACGRRYLAPAAEPR